MRYSQNESVAAVVVAAAATAAAVVGCKTGSIVVVAAGDEQNRNDDEPNGAVVKNVAKAVVHNKSSVERACPRERIRPPVGHPALYYRV